MSAALFLYTASFQVPLPPSCAEKSYVFSYTWYPNGIVMLDILWTETENDYGLVCSTCISKGPADLWEMDWGENSALYSVLPSDGIGWLCP